MTPWTVLLPEAVVVLLLPAAVGAMLGHGRHGGPVLAGLGLLALGLPVAIEALPPISEMAGMVAVAALGFVAARTPAEQRGMRAGQVLLFCAVAELGTRLVVGPAPPSAGTEAAPWMDQTARLGHDDRSELEREACALAYDDVAPSTSPWVLHLGDSMIRTVEAVIVRAPGEPLRARWSAVRPDLTHVVRGAIGTSVDVQRMALQRVLPHHPAAVLWYVFPFNDAHELGRPWPCCPDGPLLDPATHAPRCPVPTSPDPDRWTRLVRTAAAPWAVRRGAEISEVAAWVLRGWATTVHGELFRPPQDWSAVAAVVADGVSAAAAEGVPVRVVVLPDTGNRLLEPLGSRRQAVVDALHAAGLASAVVVPPFPDDDDALARLVGEDRVHFDDEAGFRVLVDGLTQPFEAVVPPPGAGGG